MQRRQSPSRPSAAAPRSADPSTACGRGARSGPPSAFCERPHARLAAARGPRFPRTASSPSVAPASASTRTPSVLAILVVRAADPALRPCLHALASQTYEQFGVLAVDDATDDDAHDLLERALGASRVIRNDERLGYARSFAVALEQPAVAAADHVLLLHGDTVLDEDAVACLVEATLLQREPAGIVGAKVVDLDRPRELRDVGRAVDRFGHAISPLQPGEIDQGQFDRILDVLAVDGCAMLVDRAVWQRIGLYDERLGADDVGLCLRARAGGWRGAV